MKQAENAKRTAGKPAIFAEQVLATRTLADRVTESLMEKISSRELPGGAQLPSEQSLASSFGVSRTVIREAVSRLKSEGLVDSKQGRGAFVRTDRAGVPLRMGIDANDPLSSLLHILELRLGLDPQIAALAATRRDRSEMLHIRRALKVIDQASRAGLDAVAEDLDFHLSITRATHNPLYFELIRYLGATFYSAIAVTRANEERQESLAQQTRIEHEAIVEAIERMDSEAASKAAREHIESASQRLLSADVNFWQGRAMQAVRLLTPRPPIGDIAR